MAPKARGARLATALVACCCFAFGCTGGTSDVRVTWTIEPSPAITESETLVRFALDHADGTPAAGARLRVEAHMSHPGMAPATADVVERANGFYETRLHLSMAGDWVVVISGELASGQRVTASTHVTAVQRTGS
jgi:hypothetical protein